MIQNPATTTADTPLLEAAEVLLNTKYGALPVVAGGHVVGILTDNDLIRALVDALREANSAQGRAALPLPREDADVETLSEGCARRFAGPAGSASAGNRDSLWAIGERKRLHVDRKRSAPLEHAE